MAQEQQFGKDHWSTLAFLETQIVDKNFPIDLKRLRVNDTKRAFSNGASFHEKISMWSNDYSTKLKDGSRESGHDDIDVIDELEEKGYIKNNGTHINIYPLLTDKGWKVCNAIREHKGNGGSFSTFDLSMAGITIENPEHRYDKRYEVPFENDGAYADDEDE